MVQHLTQKNIIIYIQKIVSLKGESLIFIQTEAPKLNKVALLLFQSL